VSNGGRQRGREQAVPEPRVDPEQEDGKGAEGHAGHDHGVRADADRGWLTAALAVIVVFMAGEVIIGFIAPSLALISDAAHMLDTTSATPPCKSTTPMTSPTEPATSLASLKPTAPPIAAPCSATRPWIP
jgi:hypothetical protein